MTRAAAVLLENDAVALIRRERAGHTYYLFPGGQVEDGETSQMTVIREIKEELGLDVTVGTLLATATFQGNTQLYYLAEITGGEFGTGDGLEIIGDLPPEYGKYFPEWIEIKKMPKLDIRPTAVVELIQRNFGLGWPQEPLEINEDIG